MEKSYIYPTLEAVDAYWREALSEIPSDVKVVKTQERHLRDRFPGITYDRYIAGTWLMFEGVDGMPFWCFWQPCSRPGPRKTLVHLTGYATAASGHPTYVHAGYNVMHVNPRGYCGPDGIGNSEWRLPGGTATVIHRNLDNPKEYGYRYWFQDAAIAVRWLQKQENVAQDKFGFFGCSQGGGAALLLGSILAPEGIVGAVAADVPFLTDFRRIYGKKARGAYDIAFSQFPKDEEQIKQAFYTLGFVDNIAHAPRMDYPVLLVAGAEDTSCPPDSVHSLYEKLPNTRAIVELTRQGHTNSPQFPMLSEAWFDLYL